MQANPSYDLDWNLVRTFVAVANNGSLAAGARALGITHPTAARHIQLLEEGLGTALFTRSGKGLVLNDMGAALQDKAALMHSSAVAFQSHIEQLKQAPVRTLRIGVAEILAELIPHLMISDVDENISLDMVVSNDVLNLLQREADMAVRHVRPSQQELLCTRVGSVAMGAFAHRDYIAKQGEFSPATAAQYRYIDGLANDHLIRGAARQGLVIQPEQIAFRSDSVACQRAAIAAGWGVGVLPLWMGAREPDWCRVFADEQIIDLEVWLVARPEVKDNQSLKAVFRSIAAALGERLAVD